MPRLCHIDGVTVWMDYLGHNPPHFHARFGEHDISVDIRDFRVMAGNLPKSKEKVLFRWANEHRQDLLDRWDDASNGREVRPIPD